jgi:hypothetical protein
VRESWATRKSKKILKSSIISPDLESENLLVDPSEIVRKRLWISRLFIFHANLDCALISLIRRLSMPERKSSLEKTTGG